jgi:abequosyltransferase
MTMFAPSKNQILLSICIPTYNNAQKLSDLLDCLSGEDLSAVELVIRDDSPSDDTKKAVHSYKHLPIKYFHGIKDGYDSAILFLTKKARGRYVWWFGDDLLEQGGVAKIKEVINGNPDLTFIWLNSRSSRDATSVSFNTIADKYFRNRDEIVETDLGLLAFGSATVVKKASIKPFMAGAAKHLNSSLMTFYLTLGAISSNGSYYLVSHPYVISDPKPSGESRWYDSFRVHGINMHLIAKEFGEVFDQKSLRKGISVQFGCIWRAVIVERALGFETGFGNRSPKVMQMMKLYWNFPEFYVALPLLLSPRPLLRVSYLLYRRIQSIFR